MMYAQLLRPLVPRAPVFGQYNPCRSRAHSRTSICYASRFTVGKTVEGGLPASDTELGHTDTHSNANNAQTAHTEPPAPMRKDTSGLVEGATSYSCRCSRFSPHNRAARLGPGEHRAEEVWDE